MRLSKTLQQMITIPSGVCRNGVELLLTMSGVASSARSAVLLLELLFDACAMLMLELLLPVLAAAVDELMLVICSMMLLLCG